MLVKVFATDIVRRRRGTNSFRGLLSLPSGPTTFLSGLLVLLILYLYSVLLATVVFKVKFKEVTSDSVRVVGKYVFTTLLL